MPPTIQLDIVYHVLDTPNRPIIDDSSRMHAAAEWIANRFGLSLLRASISIVDDPTIQAVNREHLDHDWPTDVVSLLFERIEIADRIEVDGEVICSLDTAQQLSAQAQWSAEDELLLYCIHGLLHLAGLDDLDEDQRRQMRQAEQECLAALRVAGSENHVSRWDSIHSDL
ncbi:MAG: rRNA maturation RNase YbeY [Pirellulaceae bacterium]